MIITGKEKAFLGGLGAGITTFASQLSVSNKLDTKTVLWTAGAWVFTHLFVYYTTNTPVDITENAAQLGKVVDSAESMPTQPAA